MALNTPALYSLLGLFTVTLHLILPLLKTPMGFFIAIEILCMSFSSLTYLIFGVPIGL